jgi:hypothetical protein
MTTDVSMSVPIGRSIDQLAMPRRRGAGASG